MISIQNPQFQWLSSNAPAAWHAKIQSNWIKPSYCFLFSLDCNHSQRGHNNSARTCVEIENSKETSIYVHNTMEMMRKQSMHVHENHTSLVLGTISPPTNDAWNLKLSSCMLVRSHDSQVDDGCLSEITQGVGKKFTIYTGTSALWFPYSKGEVGTQGCRGLKETWDITELLIDEMQLQTCSYWQFWIPAAAGIVSNMFGRKFRL